MPQRGDVHHSEAVALPSPMLSANPAPMSCRSRSVYGWMVWLRSSAFGWYGLVVSVGLWHFQQLALPNSAWPWIAAELVRSRRAPTPRRATYFVQFARSPSATSGVPFVVSPSSVGKTEVVTPMSLFIAAATWCLTIARPPL